MDAPAIEALEHHDVAAAIRRLATPNAFALLSDQLLGIVDTIAIGSLGTVALAGITGATAVFMVFAIGLFAFGTGLRIVGAQAIGARQSERFGTIVRSSSVTPLLIGTFLAFASTIGALPLMHAMLPAGAPADAAARYLVLRSFCLPLMVCSGQLIVAFATAGDTSLALRVLIAINVIHIPLLFVLALGLGTHHPLGLTGAGISSLIAECVGLSYAALSTMRRPELRIFSSWHVDPALLRTTASLSWPEFVFLTLQIAPEPITIALLAPSGAQLVAAYRALALVNDATWAVPGSLGDACEVIVGQRIGARDYAGAKTFTREATRIGLIVCGASAIIVAALAWPLAAISTLNAGLASIAALPLATHTAITLPLKGFAMTNLAPIRASGDTRFVMLMGIVMTALAVAGIAFAIRELHLGLWGIPFGWTIGWIFRDVATTLRLRGGDWERRRLPVS